jgi:hypothetical protein
MKRLTLLLFISCAHAPSTWAMRSCPDGREVRVLRPVVKNVALNAYLLDMRVKEQCK